MVVVVHKTGTSLKMSRYVITWKTGANGSFKQCFDGVIIHQGCALLPNIVLGTAQGKVQWEVTETPRVYPIALKLKKGQKLKNERKE